MKITRKQIRSLIRESLIESGNIILEQVDFPERDVNSQQQATVQATKEPVRISDSDMREELIDVIAKTLWEDALVSAFEGLHQEGRISDGVRNSDVTNSFASEIPPEVRTQAENYLAAFEGTNRKSFEDVMKELDISYSELNEFGSMMTLQMLGHGVRWSDDHEVELNTPLKDAEGSDAYFVAQDMILEKFGNGDEDSYQEEDSDIDILSSDDTDSQPAERNPLSFDDWNLNK